MQAFVLARANELAEQALNLAMLPTLALRIPIVPLGMALARLTVVVGLLSIPQRMLRKLRSSGASPGALFLAMPDRGQAGYMLPLPAPVMMSSLMAALFVPILPESIAELSPGARCFTTALLPSNGVLRMLPVNGQLLDGLTLARVPALRLSPATLHMNAVQLDGRPARLTLPLVPYMLVGPLFPSSDRRQLFVSPAANAAAVSPMVRPGSLMAPFVVVLPRVRLVRLWATFLQSVLPMWTATRPVLALSFLFRLPPARS